MFKLPLQTRRRWAEPSLSLASYLEGAHQGFVHAHHAARVVELSAVVRSREERHQLPLGEELVAVFHHLRGAQAQGFVSALAVSEQLKAAELDYRKTARNRADTIQEVVCLNTVKKVTFEL